MVFLLKYYPYYNTMFFQQLTSMQIIPLYSGGYSTLESNYMLYRRAKSGLGLFLSWPEQEHGLILVIACFCQVLMMLLSFLLNSHLKQFEIILIYYRSEEVLR